MRGLTIKQESTSDRGATLALVAVMLMVIFAAAALSIDLGSGWRTRRALVPGTDATALASVQGYVETGSRPLDCTSWDGVDYLTENVDNAVLVGDCTWVGDSTQGYVVVTGQARAETWFTGLLGWNPVDVRTSSAAAYGPPSAITGGLRPIGLCLGSHTDLQNAIAAETNTIVQVEYGANQPNACGPVSGNWGIVSFDGGTPSNSEIQDQLLNGYDDPVTWDDHTVTTCNLGQEEHCVSLDPGVISQAYKQELDYLINNQIWFLLPVFNFSEQASGNGFPYYVHLAAIVKVRLLGYDFTGAQALRSFTIEVDPGLVPGECCGDGGGAAGNRVVVMCAVDPTDLSACTP